MNWSIDGLDWVGSGRVENFNFRWVGLGPLFVRLGFIGLEKMDSLAGVEAEPWTDGHSTKKLSEWRRRWSMCARTHQRDWNSWRMWAQHGTVSVCAESQTSATEECHDDVTRRWCFTIRIYSCELRKIRLVVFDQQRFIPQVDINLKLLSSSLSSSYSFIKSCTQLNSSLRLKSE